MPILLRRAEAPRGAVVLAVTAGPDTLVALRFTKLAREMAGKVPDEFRARGEACAEVGEVTAEPVIRVSA